MRFRNAGEIRFYPYFIGSVSSFQPEQLQQMFDDAVVKWRYRGPIARLEDDGTII